MVSFLTQESHTLRYTLVRHRSGLSFSAVTLSPHVAKPHSWKVSCLKRHTGSNFDIMRRFGATGRDAEAISSFVSDLQPTFISWQPTLGQPATNFLSDQEHKSERVWLRNFICPTLRLILGNLNKLFSKTEFGRYSLKSRPACAV